MMDRYDAKNIILPMLIIEVIGITFGLITYNFYNNSNIVDLFSRLLISVCIIGIIITTLIYIFTD